MIGQTISHYKITEKLGEGGMGVVYKTEDTQLERPVALKFLAAHAIEDPEHKARFIREAKAAARLDHQNICSVHEIDEAEGQTFLAMAYLEGHTVKDKIAARPLKLDQALDIAVQTAQGLQAAHEKDIVHCDIKSANLMATPPGRRIFSRSSPPWHGRRRRARHGRAPHQRATRPRLQRLRGSSTPGTPPSP